MKPTEALKIQRRMNSELKAKWVAALRSGDYKQVKGQLFNPEKQAFCCLGVLCQINGAEWQTTEEDEDGGEMERQFPNCEFSSTGAMLEPDAFELTEQVQEKLVEMNDGGPNIEEQKTFAEIADWIETNL